MTKQYDGTEQQVVTANNPFSEYGHEAAEQSIDEELGIEREAAAYKWFYDELLAN